MVGQIAVQPLPLTTADDIKAIEELLILEIPEGRDQIRENGVAAGSGQRQVERPVRLAIVSFVLGWEAITGAVFAILDDRLELVDNLDVQLLGPDRGNRHVTPLRFAYSLATRLSDQPSSPLWPSPARDRVLQLPSPI